jgi:hypothetical protein
MRQEPLDVVLADGPAFFQVQGEPAAFPPEGVGIVLHQFQDGLDRFRGDTEPFAPEERGYPLGLPFLEQLPEYLLRLPGDGGIDSLVHRGLVGNEDHDRVLRGGRKVGRQLVDVFLLFDQFGVLDEDQADFGKEGCVHQKGNDVSDLRLPCVEGVLLDLSPGALLEGRPDRLHGIVAFPISDRYRGSCFRGHRTQAYLRRRQASLPRMRTSLQ